MNNHLQCKDTPWNSNSSIEKPSKDTPWNTNQNSTEKPTMKHQQLKKKPSKDQQWNTNSSSKNHPKTHYRNIWITYVLYTFFSKPWNPSQANESQSVYWPVQKMDTETGLINIKPVHKENWCCTLKQPSTKYVSPILTRDLRRSTMYWRYPSEYM